MELEEKDRNKRMKRPQRFAKLMMSKSMNYELKDCDECEDWYILGISTLEGGQPNSFLFWNAQELGLLDGYREKAGALVEQVRMQGFPSTSHICYTTTLELRRSVTPISHLKFDAAVFVGTEDEVNTIIDRAFPFPVPTRVTVCIDQAGLLASVNTITWKGEQVRAIAPDLATSQLMEKLIRGLTLV